MPAAILDETEIDAPPDFDSDAEAELLKCRADPAYFIDSYGVIDDAQDHGGSGGGTTPFRLWTDQVALLWTLSHERLVVILKARQLGISWAVCGYVLWLALFHAGQAVLLLSKGQPEANELLRRVKAMYDRLPGWLRELAPALDKDNTREVEFSNGSRILSLAATRNAGVSYTASLVVMDEAAHMMWGEELYLNVKPTIDAGGQLIVLSTANGFGGLFHTLWNKAVSGLNAFKTVFLPWWSRPDRGPDFLARVRAESTDPKLVPQNYPANPVEAFLASGATRFEPEWIAAQAKNIRAPLPGSALPPSLLGIRGLEVFAVPAPGRRYAIGADVAEGLEHGDYDSADVLDEETWEQVATIHGHFEPYEFAAALVLLSAAYDDAQVTPERNNHGHAVLTAFLLARDRHGDPAPFRNVGRGPDGMDGWPTTEKTKAPGIDLLAEALKRELVTIRSAATLAELQVYKRLKGGKTGAPEGFHDDRVMSLYVTLSQIREDANRGRHGAPQAAGEPFAIKGVIPTTVNGKGSGNGAGPRAAGPARHRPGFGPGGF